MGIRGRCKNEVSRMLSRKPSKSRGNPLFFSVWGLSMVYTLSGPMVYTLLPCFPKEIVCTRTFFGQQVLNPTPLNPTPATCHKRKRKLRCSFRSAALQKLHCNCGFSAVRKSFGPKAALQQAKNCTATSKKLRCRQVALSCRFPAGFKPPRLGSRV